MNTLLSIIHQTIVRDRPAIQPTHREAISDFRRAIHRTMLSCLLLVTLLVAAGAAQQTKVKRGNRAYPPRLEGARVEVYKTTGDVRLHMYIFTPEDHRAGDKAAAIVFFFGGGWRSGSPGQFQEQCRYLASRGMVAMAADYRVASRHQVKAATCVADAKSAIRWIRANARRLGIDPDRLAAGGGSAGGHLAAATGTLPDLDDPEDDLATSCVPTALVLFNPAVVLATVDEQLPFSQQRTAEIQARMGTDPVNISPYHHIRPGTPPTIIFHGTADSTVPFETVRMFKERMTQVGNRCTLVAAEGEGHGFFNFGRGDGSQYRKTMYETDKFLTSLGFLDGQPTIDD
jgi:acetyl esterase/lipase